MTGFGRPKTSGGWRFAHLLLLLVLAWQGIVLQSHTHFAPTSDAPIAATTNAVARAETSSTVPAAPFCLLCEEQALFGAYVLAAPVAFIAPVADVAWYDATASPCSVLSRASHSWRSRAPPAVQLSTI